MNKFFLLIFSFFLYFIINTLLFDNDTIHKEQIKFEYNIIPVIFSMMILSFITIILKLLALSNNNIPHLIKSTQKNKNKAKKQSVKIIKELNLKFNILLFFRLYIFIYFAILILYFMLIIIILK